MEGSLFDLRDLQLGDITVTSMRGTAAPDDPDAPVSCNSWSCSTCYVTPPERPLARLAAVPAA